jgi:hypothetical protein
MTVLRLQDLLDHVVLVLVALGVVLLAAVDSGDSGVPYQVAGLLLCIAFLSGARPTYPTPHHLWLPVAIVLAILVTSWTFSPGSTSLSRSVRLLEFLVVLGAIYHLSQTLPSRLKSRAVFAVAVLVLAWQSAIRSLEGAPFGSFENPHYLAYFACLLMPVLVLMWARTTWLPRILVAGLVALNLVLVVNDGTKPAIPTLALTTALLGVVLTLQTSAIRTAAVMSIVIAVPLVVWTQQGLVEQILMDERLAIWGDALRLIFDSSWSRWLVGHGMGAYAQEIALHPQVAYPALSFPHNPVLQLGYENGLPITLLVSAGVVAMVIGAVRLARTAPAGTWRQVARANLAGVLIWLVFSSLAFGSYSTYTLYPLAILVGIHLALAERSRMSARSGIPSSRTKSG